MTTTQTEEIKAVADKVAELNAKELSKKLHAIAEDLGVVKRSSGLGFDRGFDGYWYVHNFFTSRKQIPGTQMCENAAQIIEAYESRRTSK